MKGILFKPWKIDFIDCLKEGDLFVTRRAGKELAEINREPDKWDYKRNNNDGRALFWRSADTASAIFEDPDNIRLVKPRYLPGEVVYVKEAWAVIALCDDYAPRDIPMCNHDVIWYQGESDWQQHGINPWPQGNRGKWRSPMFMPAWAARLFFQIVDDTPEYLTLPLPPDEMALEGGDLALEQLEKINGLWVWRDLCRKGGKQ